MSTAKLDRRNAFFCAAVVLVSIGLTVPFGESGVNDDWSYTRTALDLAQTGQLRYNGWAAAMVGAQAYWGAAFIKLFGFSFLVTRLSTAPLAAGCALLLYALHRRAGLSATLSIFGTLTIVLSPIFIPHAASFMTEVPAFFFLLLSVFGYVRALEILDESGSAGRPLPIRGGAIWLITATVSGFLAGTVRQAYWVLPVLAPLFLIIRASSRTWASTLRFALLSLVSLLSAAACTKWFYEQPYAIHERVADAFHILGHGKTGLLLARPLTNAWLMLVAIALPIVIAIAFAWPAILARRRWSIAFAILAIVLGAIPVAHKVLFGGWWLFPWLPNTFTITPYLTGTTPIPPDDIRVTLPWAFWKGFSFFVMSLASTTAAIAVLALFWPPRNRVRAQELVRNTPAPVAVFALFAAGYLPLLLLKSLVPGGAGLFDRYLLPLVPLLSLVGLRLYAARTAKARPPLLAWVALVLAAYYGLAQTHDYFALLRARSSLTRALEDRGIPRDKIMGGFEYDSWTQITATGYYNDPRIEKPKLQYVPPKPLSFRTEYVFWQCTPVVQAEYIISLGEHSGLTSTDLPPTSFLAWLPPFSRRCLVQTTDPSLASVLSLPVHLN